ncbi:MAG TPA: UDP-N-acetylmuramate--L-alanine ligase, partial [Planctomycetaceae bacterium]|nr:UDP-N-acetylmuramate--L-alanine ligase [Planctomycetaceae bacterium]
MTIAALPVSLPRTREASGRAHLVGVCGSGMKGLAHLLVGLGWQVTGSDVSPLADTLHPLRARGFRFVQGHTADQLPRDADVLIHSAAIGSDNLERIAARELGISQMTYSQMLGRLMLDRRGVCVAGTHGKSTTTAMTATILTDAGRQPSAIFGADLCSTGQSSWSGRGDLFVVESCEFQRSFLDLSPQCAAILGVEPDHFDCYRNRDELLAAFSGFAANVSPSGFLLLRAEDAAAMEAGRAAKSEVLTFGWTSDADWWANDVRSLGFGSRFRLFRRGQYVTEIQLDVPGRHNVMNAVAAAAMCSELGVSAPAIRHSLAEFSGLKRRFDVLGSWRGVTVIDDYAHHPTAVTTTLQTARDLYGRRRIWAAFQPHQVGRTAALMPDFARSFRLADHVVIAPVYAAREAVTDEPLRLAEELARQVNAEGPPAMACNSLDQLAGVLDDGL